MRVQPPPRHTGHGRKSVGSSSYLNTCGAVLKYAWSAEERVGSIDEFKAKKRIFPPQLQPSFASMFPAESTTYESVSSVAPNIWPYPWENAINIAGHVRFEARKGESGDSRNELKILYFITRTFINAHALSQIDGRWSF